MSKNKLKWHVIYIGTKDGNLKYTYYTNPQPGGQFVMTKKLLHKYTFLQMFVSTKPIAALLCQKITKEPTIPVTMIAQSACSSELQHIEATRNFMIEFRKSNDYTNLIESRTQIELFYEYYASKFLNFTLVMHPVGRHYDVFADNTCSLENRVCVTVDKVYSKLDLSSYGRGGHGINKFTYALLDWETHHKVDRNEWTRSENNDLLYSAYWYALKGKIDQRFTKAVKNNFYHANPHLQSQSLVDSDNDV